MLELFSGKAGITRSVADVGAWVATPLDTVNDSGLILGDTRVLRVVRRRLRSGAVWRLWTTLPCSDYGVSLGFGELTEDRSRRARRLLRHLVI